MNPKQNVINKIHQTGIVSVVRSETKEQAYRTIEACLAGGISAIEVTFTVPNAHHIVEDLAGKYSHDEMILGAGTVLDAETARIAILSGARYIVMPYFNQDVVRMCNRYAIPCMPGVMTIKEVVEAMESGVEIMKLFPGELFGPSMIKSIKGPLPQAQLMPTGGVDLDNVSEWLEAGAIAVGIGSHLTRGALRGDYASVTEIGKKFVEKVRETRNKMKTKNR